MLGRPTNVRSASRPRHRTGPLRSNVGRRDRGFGDLASRDSDGDDKLRGPTSIPGIFSLSPFQPNRPDWPELHQNPMLTGYTANSTINATNAGTLGVEWDTYLYGSALDSPVIAYDPILHETLAYIGTETGNVLGINIANGQIVWGLWLGSPIRSSPLVYGGSVYIGTLVQPGYPPHQRHHGSGSGKDHKSRAARSHPDPGHTARRYPDVVLPDAG